MNQCYQTIIINGESIKISAVFEGNTLDLTVFKDETAWNYNVPEDELSVLSEKHNTTYNEYYANLRKYIENYSKNIEFNFENGKFFIYMLLKNQMKMLYFHTSLNKINFVDGMFGLIDIVYKKKVKYFNELQDARTHYTSVKNDYDILENKMNEFSDRRKTEELSLCNNFIAILNEKKRHIQHLNDLLSAFRQGRPTNNPSVSSKRKGSQRQLKNNKKNHKMNPVSSSSESEPDGDSDVGNYDTDDNNSLNDKLQNKTAVIVQRETNNLSPKPSTSKIIDEFELPSESPTQPFIFPKRIRSQNHSDFDIGLPKKMKFDEQEDQNFHKDFSNTKNDRSTIVNFNTQDLLDNL